jgi:hypothetical protein
MYTTIAMGLGCVWLGKSDIIEVRDCRDGSMLGRSRASVDRLLNSPDGRSSVSVGFGIGYHSPDTIRVDQWKLKRPIRETSERIRKAGESENALRDSIEETRILHTWAWVPGPVSRSDDGSQFAVFVDDPERGIQVWSADKSDARMIFFGIGERYPDELAFLNGRNEIVMLEHLGEEKIPHISLWRISEQKCVAEYDLEYMNVNTLCGTLDSHNIALGLDQSVAILHVENGTIEAQVEVESRPVRQVRFDPQGHQIGIVTDKQLVVVDASTMRISQEVLHGGSKGLACDLRGNDMAALVTTHDVHYDKSALVLWNLAILGPQDQKAS